MNLEGLGIFDPLLQARLRISAFFSPSLAMNRCCVQAAHPGGIGLGATDINGPWDLGIEKSIWNLWMQPVLDLLCLSLFCFLGKTHCSHYTTPWHAPSDSSKLSMEKHCFWIEQLYTIILYYIYIFWTDGFARAGWDYQREADHELVSGTVEVTVYYILFTCVSCFFHRFQGDFNLI